MGGRTRIPHRPRQMDLQQILADAPFFYDTGETYRSPKCRPQTLKLSALRGFSQSPIWGAGAAEWTYCNYNLSVGLWWDASYVPSRLFD